MQTHAQRVQREIGIHARRSLPTHNHQGERVQDERDIHSAGGGFHIGQIRDPEPVGGRGGEVAVHQVHRPAGLRGRPRGPVVFAAHGAAVSELFAEPFNGAPGHRSALGSAVIGAVQVCVDLPDPVDPPARVRVNGQDFFFQRRITQRSSGRGALDEGVVSLRGDLQAELVAENPANRFDTPPMLVLVEETVRSLLWAVELRCEKSRRGIQGLVGPAHFTVFFFQLPDPRRAVFRVDR